MAKPEDLVAAFQRAHATLHARTAAAVLALWDALPAYNRPDIDIFIAQVVPLIEAAQTQMGQMVDGYTATLAAARPVGITAETAASVRSGVSTADVYERAALQAWRRMSEGMDPLQALAAARSRVASTAATDLQLAQSHAMAEVSQRQPKIVGYRRVLTGKSCMFCAAASTRRYTKGDLMPLHTHCDCSVAPIIGSKDPGEVINQELLATLKRRGPGYWKRSGFVDADGTPIDPTDLPASYGREGHNDELGPVLIAA